MQNEPIFAVRCREVRYYEEFLRSKRIFGTKFGGKIVRNILADEDIRSSQVMSGTAT